MPAAAEGRERRLVEEKREKVVEHAGIIARVTSVRGARTGDALTSSSHGSKSSRKRKSKPNISKPRPTRDSRARRSTSRQTDRNRGSTAAA